MYRKLLTALPLALACASSAPYTTMSAALNTGLGLGAAAAQRADGGCYAVCAYGTVCNPRTGFCEREVFDPCAAPGAAAGCGAPGPGLGLEEARSAPAVGGLVPVLGVTRETGRAPSPPGERPSAGAP